MTINKLKRLVYHSTLDLSHTCLDYSLFFIEFREVKKFGTKRVWIYVSKHVRVCMRLSKYFSIITLVFIRLTWTVDSCYNTKIILILDK